MPRIDPAQLLNCLQVLLSSDGGILSNDEVPRLASLMTKFSKKLVSKCVYVLILKNTEKSLLNLFMSCGGWGLIQLWLHDAMYGSNWILVKELLELLIMTPVDVERLKSNNIPKLVKSLSKREDLEDSKNARLGCPPLGVCTLASQLVQLWLKIVKDETQSEQQKNNQNASVTASALNNSTDMKSEAPVILDGNAEHQGSNIPKFSKLSLKKQPELETATKKHEDADKSILNHDSPVVNDQEKLKEDKKKSHDKSKPKSSSSKSSSKNRHGSSSSSSKDKSKDKERDRHRSSHDKDKHRSSSSHKSKSSSSSSSKSKEKKDEFPIYPSIHKLPKIPKKSSDDKSEPKNEAAKGSISIEVRKVTEERPKTVKVYKSKMRSTGLEEEAKPAPPRVTKKNRQYHQLFHHLLHLSRGHLLFVMLAAHPLRRNPKSMFPLIGLVQLN